MKIYIECKGIERIVELVDLKILDFVKNEDFLLNKCYNGNDCYKNSCEINTRSEHNANKLEYISK